MSRLVRTGLLIGVIDALWAVVLTFAYHGKILRLFQGIASTLFGPAMLDGGVPTALIGLVMHFCVAFTWSAVFLVLVLRLPWLRDILDSPFGPLKIAVVYGPIIWIVMSALVIPALVHKPVVINYRWWVQLVGHMVFVGLPITWSIGRGSR